MKIALFTCGGLVAHVTLNKIIPQMIACGIEPVLFRAESPEIERSKIPELTALAYMEETLLQDIVQPTINKFLVNDNNQDICLTEKQLIKKYNLDFYEVTDVNDDDFIDFLINKKDIKGILSIRFYHIFKKKIITAFRERGFICNLHTGILPKYKGVHMPYRSIENNDSTYGWTLHHIARGIDTGDIIAIDQLPLDPTQSVLDTYLGMCEKGAAMVMGALFFFQKRNAIPSQKQTTYFDNYFTYPTAEEIHKWKAQGIVYTRDIIRTYTNLFAAKGSTEEKKLRAELEKVIDQHGLKKQAA